MNRRREQNILSAVLVLGLGLAGCAGPGREMAQRMDQVESEMREDVEALKRAVEASYDRERAMAERLRRAEETSAQLGQEMHMLREESATLRVQLDSLQTPSLTAGGGRTRELRNGEADVFRVYRSALDQFRNRQYRSALDQFAQVLSIAPYSEWADNAQFWKGECYYGLGKYRQALTEFTKVFAYRKTEKADDAQLKIARCYLALGEKNKALTAFQKLVDEYPESEYIPAARKEMSYLGGP